MNDQLNCDRLCEKNLEMREKKAFSIYGRLSDQTRFCENICHEILDVLKLPYLIILDLEQVVNLRIET